MQFQGTNVNANLRSNDFNSLEAWNELRVLYLDVRHHNSIFYKKWLLEQCFSLILKRKYVLLFKSLQQGIYVCSGIKMSFFIYSCMIRSNLGFADFLRV